MNDAHDNAQTDREMLETLKTRERNLTREVVICIPTKRPPPIKTLLNYPPGHHPDGYTVIVIADPSVHQAHLGYYANRVSERMPGSPAIDVVLGAVGMAPQAALCYSRSREAGYLYFFRMDDDLEARTFVHKDGRYPDVHEVISDARQCLDATKTTLVGFANTSNRHWLSTGYKRTYGLVHGGASLAQSCPASDVHLFMDVGSVVRAEDVYRTCAHREHDLLLGGAGEVGRVGHIGFDKSKSTITAGQTSISVTEEQVLAEQEFMTKRFPGMVTCDGIRWINNGETPIANWRMRKTPKSYVLNP